MASALAARRPPEQSPRFFKRVAAKLKLKHHGLESITTYRADDPANAPDQLRRYELHDSAWDDWESVDWDNHQEINAKYTGCYSYTPYNASACSWENCNFRNRHTEEEQGRSSSETTSDTASDDSEFAGRRRRRASSGANWRQHVATVSNKTLYCDVCMETKPYSAFPLGKIAPDCGHSNRACLVCLSNSIASELSSKFSDQLACPLCPALLEYETVAKFATTDTFKKYDGIATRQCMTKMDNWWDCPNPDCLYGGIFDTGSSEPIVVCPGCNKSACFTCDTTWHQGKTCTQYQEGLRRGEADEKRRKEMNEHNNVASTKTVERTTKACPNKTCGVRIEKNQGCQHMTCSKCQHQFCWDCMSAWTDIMREGNTAHQRGCRWHTLNLR